MTAAFTRNDAPARLFVWGAGFESGLPIPLSNANDLNNLQNRPVCALELLAPARISCGGITREPIEGPRLAKNLRWCRLNGRPLIYFVTTYQLF
jgi:hypothetical protein